MVAYAQTMLTRFPIRPLLHLIVLLLTASLSGLVDAAVYRQHGYSVFGLPRSAADFSHLDYVNPEAPTGGTPRVMGSGTFATLNPYTLKATSPIATGTFYRYGIRGLNEPLMVGSGIYDPSGD